jgi:hypothetical protein
MCSILENLLTEISVLIFSPQNITMKLMSLLQAYNILIFGQLISRAFFLAGRRGTRTPKHFVNLTGESKNFKMLGFPLNKPQILSIDCFYFFQFEL